VTERVRNWLLAGVALLVVGVSAFLALPRRRSSKPLVRALEAEREAHTLAVDAELEVVDTARQELEDRQEMAAAVVDTDDTDERSDALSALVNR
jgi:hypothetical protein